MIVYLASYPRSGNSWVRRIIFGFFDRRTASIYMDEPAFENLNLNTDGEIAPEDLIYSYLHPQSPSEELRGLYSNCKPFLTESVREELAGLDDVFFLKTHEPPFPEFYPGEKVIHIVRHPGAVIWSYYNYLKAEGASEELRLEHVICGRVFGGLWSEHVDHWKDAGRVLGAAYIRLRYEDMVAGMKEIVEKLSSLSELPAGNPEGEFPKFQHLHEMDPVMFRSGKLDEWKAHLTDDHQSLIWALHGDTASTLGYDFEFVEDTIGALNDDAASAGNNTERDRLALIRSLSRNLEYLNTLSNPTETSKYIEEINRKEQGIQYLQDQLSKLDNDKQDLQRRYGSSTDHIEQYKTLLEECLETSDILQKAHDELEELQARIEREPFLKLLRRMRLVRYL